MKIQILDHMVCTYIICDIHYHSVFFFVHVPILPGGQTGVYDQIVALQWVKKHIHSYGGDPNQITIFGESAGGLSVCNLIISPLATGLFNRGIIESGACTSGWSVVNTSYGLTLWDEILSSANLPNNVTFLRTLSSTDLNNAVKVKATKNWQGSVDGLVLTDTPYNIYSNLDNRKDNVTFNVEKLIIGFNSMDGVDGFPWHLGPRPTTADELDKILAKNVPNEKQRNELENKYYPLKDFPPYPPGHDSYSLKYFTITADCCLICPTLNMAENINKQLKNGDEIVYIYLFGGPGKNGSYYAPHASELPFVFNIAEVCHFIWIIASI